MLATQNMSMTGLRVSVSGSGNVAQYAIEKALAMGAKVHTVSDSSGFVHDQDGFTAEKLAQLQDIKNVRYGRVDEYARAVGAAFHAGKRPWSVPVDIALPCAVENEIDESDARMLVANGVLCVAEGANMPTSLEAIKVFQGANVLYAPGKASNAGGVATGPGDVAERHPPRLEPRRGRPAAERHHERHSRYLHSTWCGPQRQGELCGWRQHRRIHQGGDAMLAQGVV